MSMVAARVKCPEALATVGKSLKSAAGIRVKCFMIARNPVDLQSCRSDRRIGLTYEKNEYRLDTPGGVINCV
jgi:hypothetical protein